MNRRRRPNAWLLPLYKLPVWLYRLKFGWLLSSRFLMITHLGRTTGKRHYIVVEVARYDKAKDEYIAMSGYGEDSDWYRNLQMSPAVEIHVGRRRFTPNQRFLAPEEVHNEFVEYERRHRLTARTLSKHLNAPYDGSEEQRHDLTAALRMVAFSPSKS